MLFTNDLCFREVDMFFGSFSYYCISYKAVFSKPMAWLKLVLSSTQAPWKVLAYQTEELGEEKSRRSRVRKRLVRDWEEQGCSCIGVVHRACKESFLVVTN